MIKLPRLALDPCHPGLAMLLARRRSQREYRDEPLAIDDVGQLLWAAQGITDEQGLRTTPSAGALYPLEVYVAAGRVTGLEPGLYRYLPRGHALTRTQSGDLRSKLSRAAHGQESLRDAPAVFAFCAVLSRTRTKYGERAERYVDMEIGSATQNAFLLAVERELASVIVGAFDDEALADTLGLASGEHPRCLMPIGYPLAD